MYKTIIFDFFGIFHTDTTRAWMQQNGLQKNEKFEEASRLADHGKISMQQYYEHLSHISDIPAESIAEDFHKLAQLDHDMVAFIKQIHMKYKTGLLSNAPTDYLRNILKKYELESLFDVIIVSAEVQMIKPDPKLFAHILEELKTPAHEAIFIDDNEYNLQGAEALGIKTIHYHDLKTLQDDLKKIDITV